MKSNMGNKEKDKKENLQKLLKKQKLFKSTPVIISDDAKAKFVKEASELIEKYNSLIETIQNIESGNFDTLPTNAPINMLKYQAQTMLHYQHILRKIAQCDNIDMSEVKWTD